MKWILALLAVCVLLIIPAVAQDPEPGPGPDPPRLDFVYCIGGDCYSIQGGYVMLIANANGYSTQPGTLKWYWKIQQTDNFSYFGSDKDDDVEGEFSEGAWTTLSCSLEQEIINNGGVYVQARLYHGSSCVYVSTEHFVEYEPL